MTTLRRRHSTPALVTVGVDGSPVSLAALAWAAQDAALRHARLRVVTAWNVLPPEGLVEVTGYPCTDEELERACHEMLDQALAPVALPPSVRLERVVRSGHPADVLEAAAADADLLVVGARGRGGFSRLLLGSVSSQCVQRSRRPVVIVRPARETPGGGRPVVCGIDGSPESRAALRFAADEAALRGLPLLAVQVVYWDLAGIDLIRPLAEQLHEWGRQLLTDTIADVLGAPEPPSVEPRTVEGHPAEVLGDLSREAALLVVGTRGRSAVESTLLGSVSGYCLRRAECPVVVVPAAPDERDGGQ